MRTFVNRLAFAVALISMVAVVPTPVSAQGEGMLYLVEFEASAAGAPAGPAQALALLETQIVPSLEALGKEGRIKAGGILVGARAGVFIVAAKSHDEVTAMVRALPAWGVWEWTVTPLESFASRAALEKKNTSALRAQVNK